MVVFKRHSVRIADLFFDEAAAGDSVDVLRFNQWSKPVPGLRVPPFHTVVLDVRAAPQELLENMDKGTRYEIRRAEKEWTGYACFGGARAEEAVDLFRSAYDDFAEAKGLPALNVPKVKAMAASGALELSCALLDGAEMAWHAYYRNSTQAVLLHSVSAYRQCSDVAFRQQVGRANRYLHWRDILRFREVGIASVDFGGWFGDSADAGLRSVSKFKEDFGGRVVETFNSMLGVTPGGKMAVWYIRFREMPRLLHRNGHKAA